MKIKLILTLGLVALATLCSARPAEEDYDYADEAPPPPPKKVPARGPLTGRRNPLAGKTSKAATSTTTTTAAPKEEEEPVEGDYEDEAQPVETSSTTEASKKLIKSGVVRPFRSNDDLLATLKKRREQVVHNKQVKPVAPVEREEAASEPVQKESKSVASSSGRRGRFNKGKSAKSEPEEPSSTSSAPVRTGRRFSARS